MPLTVDRKPVKDEEATLALAVLMEWNAQTGQTLTSSDWLKKIIGRIREHPELGSAEHQHIIATSLATPWWKGTASPSVVYGNGAVFEKALMQTAGKPGPERREKLTAGAAADELLRDLRGGSA